MCSINLREGPLRGEMAEIYVHIHSFNESSSYIKEKMELLGNSSETMPYTFSSIIACKNTHTNTHNTLRLHPLLRCSLIETTGGLNVTKRISNNPYCHLGRLIAWSGAKQIQ